MKSVGIFVGVLCVLCGAASYAQGSGQFARFLSPRDAAITTVDDPTGLAPRSFVQRFESISSDFSVVHKYVITTFLLNKAEAFSLVEPLYGSGMSFRHELLH